MTALTELARRQSGAGREAGRAVALQVLREVFAAPAARAALAVLVGGEHEDERIIELCSAVLEVGRVDASGSAAAGKSASSVDGRAAHAGRIKPNRV